MVNKLVELINERSKQLDKIWSEHDCINKKYNQKIADILPYKDKYIKIISSNNHIKFCKVIDISVDREQINIYGLYFFGSVFEYYKEDFISYKYNMFSYHIRDIEESIDSIQIITKDEYIESYKKLSDDLIVKLKQMEN